MSTRATMVSPSEDAGCDVGSRSPIIGNPRDGAQGSISTPRDQAVCYNAYLYMNTQKGAE